MKTCTNCNHAKLKCDVPILISMKDDQNGECPGWIEKPKCTLCDRYEDWYDFCPWCGRGLK